MSRARPERACLRKIVRRLRGMLRGLKVPRDYARVLALEFSSFSPRWGPEMSFPIRAGRKLRLRRRDLRPVVVELARGVGGSALGGSRGPWALLRREAWPGAADLPLVKRLAADRLTEIEFGPEYFGFDPEPEDHRGQPHVPAPRADGTPGE